MSKKGNFHYFMVKINTCKPSGGFFAVVGQPAGAEHCHPA
jgi:hypothetical protein